MAVPSHNSRVGSAGAGDPPSTGRNPSDYQPYPAPYYPITSTSPDASATLVGSALYGQASSTSSPTPVTITRRNNLVAAQSAARGARNYGGARHDYQGSERGPATTAQQQQQQWLGASVMPRVSTGMRTARGRNFEDALVPPAYNNAPVAAAAAVTAAYPVASAAPRSTASSSSLSPTSLSSLLYNQGVSNGTTGGGSIALPWGAAPHRTPRGGPQGPSGVRPPHHNHAPGQVNSMLRVEVPPLAEQYPPTQYSTTEMVLAEFGPGYADLSKRELLRIIRRHAPDAFLEEYNLKGQIYNAIKSRSHSQFVQLAEQLMENYIVYCGFQNGASLPTDPQVAATAASIAAKMGVAGGQTTTAGGQAPAATATATTTGAQGAPLRGDVLTTQISASLGNGVSDDDEVTTPPPGFESVLPILFGPQQQQQPYASVASASDDIAPSLSSFDNMASVSVQAERGSSAASTLSGDAPSFTPNTELQRGRYSWDTQSLSHQPQASRLDAAPADDSLAKLAEQLVRTYGLGRADMVGLPGLAASPRNAPTTGTNVSVAGSGPRTNASSSSSDSFGLCSMGGLSGQFDLSTSGTSGSSHLSATAPAFTPSNASWWNPMSSAPTSSSVSESSAAIPQSATNPPNLATCSNLAGCNTDTVDTATLASLIANLSSTSPSSASSTPHVSVASDHNINTEVSANGLAQQQQQQGESKPDQEGSVEGHQRPSNDDDSLPGSSSK
ncbi:hypothetical protein FOL46_009128 [Perkinsus olseni]|uniref:FKBP3 basic tilted helix bundle domain-containing protein n=1 Tax=Perkinsus olseni TaxID=32597 RepID=A0A7J6MWB2_PEROL|nr:hypothetical protein FOL46_009128 [Perkinsus olseni]